MARSVPSGSSDYDVDLVKSKILGSDLVKMIETAWASV